MREPGAMVRATWHWREYLIEAGALGCFMVSACVVGTLIGRPTSPVHHVIPSPVLRRAVTGALMGLTLAAIVYSPWGKRSGAHLNPALTLTFLRLRRVAPRDAACYAAAQFIGGALGVMAAHLALGAALADPPVRYVVTAPGPAGIAAAFASELAISAILLSVVLRSNASPRWMRHTGLVAGALVALYITVEAPLSGMSMNPARTLASALAAGEWRALWVYFTAPLAGMLLAAELFVRRSGATAVPCAKMRHAEPCLFCDYWRPRAARELAREMKRAPGTFPSPPELQPPKRQLPEAAMSSDTHYDVIIIGSGAGGGTLAYRLAPSGKRVLLLERGDYVPREPENWSTRAVNVEGRYNTKEVWRDAAGAPLHPHTNYFVGGNTKFYGAALFRLRREDFGELRHHGGISPAWPISYDDLEPYYTEAERLYQVHGERGADPTEPAASAPYAYPPVSHEPRIQQLHDDWSARGHHPFHTPLGIRLDETSRRRSACIRCATCDGHPCLVAAKSDAQTLCVDPALEHGNVTLLTNAFVRRLETSPSGREVSGVIVERDGATERYSADIVVVACGAINSAALLLRSTGERHPRGLANSSDVVGRHYMGHVNSVLMAISRCPNPTVFQKSLALNDYYFGTAEWTYPMGHISFVGKLDAPTLSAGAPAIAPEWTLELMATHSLDFWLTSEDLPDPDNRVTLSRDGEIVLSYRPNNEEGHRRLHAKLKELMKEQRACSVHGRDCHVGLFARSLYVGQRIPLAGVAHQNGTIRFGHDPRTSALDPSCRAHDVDNLYVADASFFPSCGAVNPALTIMANALRVGDHLLERMGVPGAAVRAPRPGYESPAAATHAVR
ncbi:MAG TPA: FAD-dependent oxidoreductase [Gemmatimonadaceae bacterium]|nr:FAD-dependent oxidoreductase [Gemmatimonadaceae bacterium]